MHDQTNMQRPAYFMRGHLPVHYRDQYVVVMKDGNISRNFSVLNTLFPLVFKED